MAEDDTKKKKQTVTETRRSTAASSTVNLSPAATPVPSPNAFKPTSAIAAVTKFGWPLLVALFALVVPLSLYTDAVICPEGFMDAPIVHTIKNIPSGNWARKASVVLVRTHYCDVYESYVDNKSKFITTLPAHILRLSSTLSYYRPHGGNYESHFLPDSLLQNYAKGPADIMFVLGAFCVLAVLQKCFGYFIRRVKTIAGLKFGHATEERFTEQAFLLFWYTMSASSGYYIYFNSRYYPLYRESEGLWSDYPRGDLPGYIKSYYLIQAGFWMQQLFFYTVLTASNERRKDHWPMVAHHVITISLVVCSYIVHMTPVGICVLFVMDAADAVLSLAKCLKYMGPKLQTLCDLTFGLFVLVWIVTRHILFFFLMYSIFWVGPATMTHIKYDPYFTRQVNSIADIERPGTYIGPGIWVFFKIMFTSLQILLLYWLMLLFRVLAKVLKGSGAQDVREDEDDS